MALPEAAVIGISHWNAPSPPASATISSLKATRISPVSTSMSRASSTPPRGGPLSNHAAPTTIVALRERLGLKPGSAVHLRPRRVTRFAEELTDPAAMI